MVQASSAGASSREAYNRPGARYGIWLPGSIHFRRAKRGRRHRAFLDLALAPLCGSRLALRRKGKDFFAHLANCRPETLAIFDWYAAESVLRSEAAAAGVRFSHEIQLEDGAICEKVQRNLRSRSYERGRFSVKQEKGVHHFHRLYAAVIGM